jgi:hypothetical protein
MQTICNTLSDRETFLLRSYMALQAEYHHATKTPFTKGRKAKCWYSAVEYLNQCNLEEECVALSRAVCLLLAC